MTSRLLYIVLLAALAGGCSPNSGRPASVLPTSKSSGDRSPAPEPPPEVDSANEDSEQAPEVDSASQELKEAPDNAPTTKSSASCDQACLKACEPHGEELADACAAAWLDGCFEQPRREGADCTLFQPAPKPRRLKSSGKKRSAPAKESAPESNADGTSESGEGQALPKLFGDP
jgi:hypothetical protein